MLFGRWWTLREWRCWNKLIDWLSSDRSCRFMRLRARDSSRVKGDCDSLLSFMLPRIFSDAAACHDAASMDMLAVVVRCIAGPPGITDDDSAVGGPLIDFVVPVAESLRAMVESCGDDETRGMLLGAVPALKTLAVVLDERASGAAGIPPYAISSKRVGAARSVDCPHPYSTPDGDNTLTGKTTRVIAVRVCLRVIRVLQTTSWSVCPARGHCGWRLLRAASFVRGRMRCTCCAHLRPAMSSWQSSGPVGTAGRR